MKKLFILSFALILFIGLSASDVIIAQNKTDVQKKTVNDNTMVKNQNMGRNFVDKDNGGVCDNNKLGRGKGMGRSGSGIGRNFVDNDKDGKCDNFSQRSGSGRFQGKGPNFVDKNNDGICDNRHDGMRNGKSSGRGNGNCDGTHKGHRGRR